MSLILVTGGNGQLGRELQGYVPEVKDHTFLFHDIDTLDICNPEALDLFVRSNRPDYLINCAAYTAVDKAEEEQEQAYLLNEQGVKNLVIIAREHRIQLIHISTDFVFDGNMDHPYREDDPPNPLSVYGKSKLAGEKAMVEQKTGIIIRTSWLYSAFGNNFVRTMLRIGMQRDEVSVVNDQTGSPTWAKDLAKALIMIVGSVEKSPVRPVSGIFHYSNVGQCSWYEFAVAIMEAADLKCRVIPIPSSEYSQMAERPRFSVLDKRKIKDRFGLHIPDWRLSLNDCIKDTSISGFNTEINL
jgi:dTDP-4-dehydrorhamnose reductase